MSKTIGPRIGRSFEELWAERGINLDKKSTPRFKMYRDEKISTSTIHKMVLTGIIDTTALSDAYFSPQNIKKIQNLTRYTVWKSSNKLYIIDEQDQIELSIVMRSIFLQHSKNQPDQISSQIKELNKIVAEEIAPGIVGRVQQYLVYLRDKQKPYRLIERPKNVSSAGLKSLRIDSALGF